MFIFFYLFIFYFLFFFLYIFFFKFNISGGSGFSFLFVLCTFKDKENLAHFVDFPPFAPFYTNYTNWKITRCAFLSTWVYYSVSLFNILSNNVITHEHHPLVNQINPITSRAHETLVKIKKINYIYFMN